MEKKSKLLKTSDGLKGPGWKKANIISTYSAQLWDKIPTKTKEFLKTGGQIPVQYKMEIIGWVKDIECKEEIILFFELIDTDMAKEFNSRFVQKKVGFSIEILRFQVCTLQILTVKDYELINHLEKLKKREGGHNESIHGRHNTTCTRG